MKYLSSFMEEFFPMMHRINGGEWNNRENNYHLTQKIIQIFHFFYPMQLGIDVAIFRDQFQMSVLEHDVKNNIIDGYDGKEFLLIKNYDIERRFKVLIYDSGRPFIDAINFHYGYAWLIKWKESKKSILYKVPMLTMDEYITYKKEL